MTGPLITRLRASASIHAETPALTFIGSHDQSYTFGELFARSEDLGRRFAEIGLSRDAPVGILLGRQEDQILHYLGLLCAGLVPAILTPPNPKLNRSYYLETMADILRRSDFAAIVTDLDDLDTPAELLSSYQLRSMDPRKRRLEIGAPLDAAFIQFSSGTTGIKRGVLVNDNCALAQVDAYGVAIELSPADTIVSWLPLYHDMGFMACLNMPLAWGVHTVMMDSVAWVSNPSLFLRAISDHAGTLAWNPNFAYSFMAQRVRDRDIEGVDLSSIRGLVNCSEPVTHRSQEQFAARFEDHGLRNGIFWGCYAMAETTFALTHCNAPDLDPLGPLQVPVRDGETRVSVGAALSGVQMRVVSDSGELLPDRHLGEIHVRSPFAFSGYFNDEEATTRAHLAGWYKTGDLGYRIGESLYVVDRKGDLMIVNGVNVFPWDLEQLMSSVGGVIPGRSVAFSEFDPRIQSQRVIVLFEPQRDQPDRRESVVVEARTRILAAFQIANFEVHSVPPGWLVKSSAGKISRTQNRLKWSRERAGGLEAA